MADSRLAIIGGGAAGYFAAINVAELCPGLQVSLFEAGSNPLAKVKISGGGRCNVTHSCFDPKQLVDFYPRGNKELLGAFHRFQPEDTIRWFRDRGVTLRVEADGRIFPKDGDSSTIVECFESLAKKHGVQVQLQRRVEKLAPLDSKWMLTLLGEEEGALYDFVLVATGSNPSGWRILRNLGHRIVPPVPSLFTFKVDDRRLSGLSGVSFPAAEIALLDESGKELASQKGPLLITHWGLSGPVVLKLSAWAAIQLNERKYRGRIRINFLAEPPELGYGSQHFGQIQGWTSDRLLNHFLSMQKTAPRKQPSQGLGVDVPRRFRDRLISTLGNDLDRRWAELSKQAMKSLVRELTAAEFMLLGKATFKEEFVTAGGVDLKEVDFRRMESKVCPNLFFAGEVLNIDGITGGFNFQNAWTGGYIAAEAIAQRV